MLWEELLFKWYHIQNRTANSSNYIYKLTDKDIYALQITKEDKVIKIRVDRQGREMVTPKTVFSQDVFDLGLKKRIIIKAFDEIIEVDV